MRKILIGLLALCILIVPVLADNSVPSSSFISELYQNGIYCDGPDCTQEEIYGDSVFGLDSSINVLKDGYFITWTHIRPVDDDVYNIVIEFSNGEVITGQIIQTPISNVFEIVGKDNRVELDGYWFNTTEYFSGINLLIFSTSPSLFITTGVDTSNNTYYLLAYKDATINPIPDTWVSRLEIPLDFNPIDSPIQSISVSSESSGEFYYTITLKTKDMIIQDLKDTITAKKGIYDYVADFTSIIGIFWTAILLLFGPNGIFDFLIIHAGLIWIFVMLESSMMAYYSLTSKNIFIFFKRMIKGNQELFIFIINIAQGTLQAIKAGVDLVNPLRWIFG